MPEKIGKYEILEQIGVGGFGAVYRGRDPFIKRTVAVKTCQLNDEEIKSRFFREAELAGNLHHRNVTTIYDFGVEEGVPYIVQEFLSGEDLDKIIKRGDKMPIPRKLEILMAIAEGLGYAHQHSIIHRDIKPANIRVLEGGAVKIMDFGIAKSLQTESSLTQTGITLGTSAYLAPEQIRGEPLDQRTDVFSLGILAYELLSYRKPFRGEHLSTVLYKILNEAPEPLQSVNPEVLPPLGAVVARAMEKSIDQRYPDMEAFGRDLSAIYKEMVGASERFATVPRPSQSALAPTSSEIDSDTTVKTPSKGLPSTQSITPPSGALARVPAPDDHTPTVASARPAGLELVNFRGPTEGTTEHARPESNATARRHGLLWTAVAIAAIASGGVVFLLLRGNSTPTVPRPGPTPAPAAPIAFPPPVVGMDARPAPASAPAPPAAAPTGAVAKDSGKKKQLAPPPARRVKMQFSSIPIATLSIDGRLYGPSIPAKTIELSPGTHTVRFEAPDLPPYEKQFLVGANGAAPIAYRFPVGFLVIHAPEWVGATILIDSKFKGILTGDKSFSLPSGSHHLTLSREGVAPLTQDVAVPQGDRKTWTPPPPSPAS